LQFSEKKKRKVLINITSLIDVLFLLLIFFMASSTFLEQPGIKLELPYAESAAIAEQKDYTLFIDKDGNMFLNDDTVDLDNLASMLKEALPAMEDGALILKADKDVTHGTVVRVMDISKKSGVKKLIIGTKLEE